MAVLSFSGIGKSVFSTGRKTSLASKTIKNISNILLNKTSSKKNISNNILRYKNRRIENERRMQAQSELFASSAVTRPGGARRLALSQVGGTFLSRIMQFAGFLTAGWILTNMPTWIAGANELSNRIQSLSSTFTGFVDNIWDMMADIGRISGALFENMKAFDLTDSSSRVRNSMTGLIGTLDSMGDQLKEAFSVLTEPFMNVPPLGTKAGPGAYPDVPAAPAPSAEEPAPSVSGNLSDLQKQALNILSKYESAGAGGYNAVNQIGIAGGRGVSGFSGDFRQMRQHGGRALTDMTIAEIMNLQAEKPGMSNREWINQGRLHAVGRYQFIGITLPGVVKRAGIPTSAKFTPEVQDLLALQLLKETGIGSWVGPSDRATKQERMIIEQARKEPISYKPRISQGSPQQQSSQTEQRAISTPTRTIKPTITSRYGDLRGSRRHGGTDLATNYGTPVTAVADGQIIETGWESGWGYFLVYREDKSGLYHLYGHMPKGSYKTSGQIKKGQVIGKVGSTGRSSGPHLHWEVGKSWNGTIGGKFDPLNLYSSSAPFSTYSQSTPVSPLVPSSESGVPQPSSEVQIESSATEYDLLSEILLNASLAANRQDIVLINDLQPATTQMSGGSGGATLDTRVSQSDLVNSFIKNKLLLDLNYL